ncbi:hypothetical protein L204_105953 [Cryptococcus depauperatus]
MTQARPPRQQEQPERLLTLQKADLCRLSPAPKSILLTRIMTSRRMPLLLFSTQYPKSIVKTGYHVVRGWGRLPRPTGSSLPTAPLYMSHKLKTSTRLPMDIYKKRTEAVKLTPTMTSTAKSQDSKSNQKGWQVGFGLTDKKTAGRDVASEDKDG